VSEAVDVPVKEPAGGYQLWVVQEARLALLAREPSHGYRLRAWLQLALGALARALNAGHVYMTLHRREGAGLVTSARVGQADRPDRKVHELTAPARAQTELA
jgi:DNA-binding PadR family transcriptional regulator